MRRLRWRSVRSYAVIADSLSGHSDRIASSRKSRRLDGSPITITRSSGPKYTARTCRRRSRLRRTRDRLTCTRLAPRPGISTSTRTLPASSVKISPRAYAGPSEPRRTIGSLDEVLGDSRKNRNATPSSRLLLPSPLGPATVTSPPGRSSRRVSPWLRRSRSSTHASRKVASADRGRQAHGHHQVGELVRLAADDPGLQSVADLEADRLPRCGGQAVGEIRRVERRGDVLAFVARLDRLDRLPEIGRGGRQLDAQGVELEPHARRVAREQAHAPNRIDQLLPRHRQPALVLLGQELPVVRELALDQPGGEHQGADLERDLALVEEHLDVALLHRLSRAAGLRERPLGDDGLGLAGRRRH